MMAAVTPPQPPPPPQYTPGSFACYSNTTKAAAATTCGSLSATPAEIVPGLAGLAAAAAKGDHDHGLATADHRRSLPPTATASTPAPVPLSSSHSHSVATATTTAKTSTFNAKFRVHSRHRSIGRLEELSLRRNHQELAVKLMLIEPPTAPILSPSSPLDQSSVGSRTRLEKLRENEQVVAEHEIGKSFREKEKQAPVGETMSQTIQSIHSLSMQLNRAASMQDQLDEICHLAGPQTLNLHNQQPGEEQSGFGPTRTDMSLAGSKLSRLVSKKAARVKEMLLQNLGKSDRTRDEIFQMYEENFYKQQAHALKLQKEFKSYVSTLANFQVASKSLNSCIQQSTGHYQSARHDLVCENLNHLEHLNDDLMDKLRGQVLASLQEYLAQFNELRDKIAKRRRKLIDYDSSRRIYELMLANVNKKRLAMQQGQSANNNNNLVQGAGRSLKSAFMVGNGSNSSQAPAAGGSLQTATSQLMDEARLLKLREQFNYCKVMYDAINSELHEELPMVYEKKMKSLLMTLQNYFSLEAQFHSNAGKLFATSSDVIDELPMSIRQHQKQQQHHHHQHQGQAANDSSTTDVYGVSDGVPTSKGLSDGSSAGKGAIACGGSSGMGSSRGGDSSLDESSSSSLASIDGDKTPIGEPMPRDEAKDIEEVEAVEIVDEKLAGDETSRQSVVGQPEEDEEEEEIVTEVGCEAERLNTFSESVVVEAVDAAVKVVAKIEDNSTSITPEVLPKIILPGELEVVEDKREMETEREVGIEGREQAAPVSDEAEGPTSILGCGFLYKVKTSYKYLAEDVDELCFEADEIIQVVQFDESQEQEEGWLMGIREVNGQRGLFPANFTRPI